MMRATLELDMLPAQIPLTLEHLFPILSNSNAKRTARAVLFFVKLGTHLEGAQRYIIGGWGATCGYG